MQQRKVLDSAVITYDGQDVGLGECILPRVHMVDAIQTTNRVVDFWKESR